MKTTFKFISCVAGMLFVQNANSTILSVDNKNSSPAPYTVIQDAVNAAVNGDTIFVAGSPLAYAPFNSGKSLHFFGSGYEPNKQNPHPTTISGVSKFELTGSGSTILTDASGSTLEGFSMTNLTLVGYSPNHQLNNIEIRRSFFSSGISLGQYLNDIRVINNRLNTISGGNYINNILFHNNISNSYSIAGHATLSGTIVASNNLFTATSGTLGNINNTIFTNNIFYGLSPTGNINNCTFNNNISYQTSNDNFPSTGNNTVSNNQTGVNPLFVNSASAGFVTTNDYNLQTTSPGSNSGTDNSDIGIYGGAYPWSEGGASGSGFMYSQEANIPQVNELNILNSTVPLNGTLNIEVKGIANH